MTPKELSSAGIAVRMRLKFPEDAEQETTVIFAPPSKIAAMAGKADIVATHGEAHGVAMAAFESGDKRIDFSTLRAVVRAREAFTQGGLPVSTVGVWPEEEVAVGADAEEAG